MKGSPAESSRVPAKGPDDNNPPQANVQQSRWLGWIWLLPVAALVAVGYFGINAVTNGRPTVHVIFPGAADIRAGDTKVKFQSQNIGNVESVTLENDLQHTDVEISLQSQLAGHLGPDTRFWIAGGQLSLNDVSELKTIISGPYIGIDPRPGKETHHFTGLEQTPVLAEQPAGHHYHLHESKLGTVSRDSPVLNLGVAVGKVITTAMAPDGQGVDIEAFVRAPYDKLVHEGTRFWDASAVQLATGSSGPSVQFQSLPALISGAVAFETPPEAKDQPVAANDSKFKLYSGQGAAENAPTDKALAYRVVFSNPTGTLTEGAAVTLASKRIGSVGDTAFDYDADTRKLLLHATLMLEPERLPVEHGSGSPREQMNMMLGELILQGLRAGMESSPPVVGSQQIALRFVPHAAPASLGNGSEPEIPITSGADVEGIMAQASDVMAKVNAMPLGRIADNLQQTTQRLAELSHSPEVTQALQHVNEAVSNVQRLSAAMSRELPSALNRLNQTVQTAQGLIGQEREVANQPQTSTVPATLYEVRQAAASIRELANELDRNPQALLTGR